jgi:hypothetical protein
MMSDASTPRTAKPRLKPPRRESEETKRNRLLNTLRKQSKMLETVRRTIDLRTAEGLIFDLARAAAHCPARSIVWQGVRFPIRHQMLCLAVLDPWTKENLVLTVGGAVAL